MTSTVFWYLIFLHPFHFAAIKSYFVDFLLFSAVKVALCHSLLITLRLNLSLSRAQCYSLWNERKYVQHVLLIPEFPSSISLCSHPKLICGFFVVFSGNSPFVSSPTHYATFKFITITYSAVLALKWAQNMSNTFFWYLSFPHPFHFAAIQSYFVDFVLFSAVTVPLCHPLLITLRLNLSLSRFN